MKANNNQQSSLIARCVTLTPPSRAKEERGITCIWFGYFARIIMTPVGIKKVGIIMRPDEDLDALRSERREAGYYSVKRQTCSSYGSFRSSARPRISARIAANLLSQSETILGLGCLDGSWVSTPSSIRPIFLSFHGLHQPSLSPFDETRQTSPIRRLRSARLAVYRYMV